MIVYFLRHGKAEQGSAAPDDDERTLTAAGTEALRAAAPLWRRRLPQVPIATTPTVFSRPIGAVGSRRAPTSFTFG